MMGVIGVPVGLVYVNAGEWFLHKYVLHRMGKRPGSFWRYHWYHHGEARRNDMRDIHAEVLRGMNRNSSRSMELIVRHLPRFLHALGRDFAGVQGSRIHTALQQGTLPYRSYFFEKGLA